MIGKYRLLTLLVFLVVGGGGIILIASISNETFAAQIIITFAFLINLTAILFDRLSKYKKLFRELTATLLAGALFGLLVC